MDQKHKSNSHPWRYALVNVRQRYQPQTIQVSYFVEGHLSFIRQFVAGLESIHDCEVMYITRETLTYGEFFTCMNHWLTTKQGYPIRVSQYGN